MVLSFWSNNVSLALISMLFFCGNTFAQTQAQVEEARQAAEEQEASSVPLENFIKNETTISNPLFMADDGIFQEILPFGANLFDSGPLVRQRNAINPQYLIAPGDKISVQLWGAVTSASVLIVDNQGNIFIPNVGPVNVMGAQASDVNQIVTDKIKQIYTDNVNIYVNLLASTPVGVFVTGNVERPGQYAGSASDTLLFYLQQAGGILHERGSFRSIKVIRDSQILQSVDLYEFLNEGRLPSHAFKDGDVILVDALGPRIIAEGIEAEGKSYELMQSFVSGNEVIELVRPHIEVTHVSVTGVRDNKPIARYFTLEQFREFTVRDGDNLFFNDDLRAQEISVKISGSFLGPSIYAVDSETRLHDLLATIEVEPDQANIGSVYILRESVKQEQQKLLDDSLARLERNIFTAPASSDGEARLRAQEAELVSQFIARAKEIEPLGKVVVSPNGQVANVRLEQGDEIVIPQFSDLINIAGEVMLPQALVFDDARSIHEYVNLAGGFTDRANTETYLIVHANGATTLVDDGNAWFGGGGKNMLKPGDQVLILPKVDNKLMQTIKDVTQIIFQIAVAANVATRD
ncbi:polysaccharide biosynthesis/export family protein [Ningiella sp. W23]|uniref:polysaccharide biosynthesis/export family protein n=1 Tax=Ningiella sp. W23 TaxID=3023715 RepID=UPI003757C8DC